MAIATFRSFVLEDPYLIGIMLMMAGMLEAHPMSRFKKQSY